MSVTNHGTERIAYEAPAIVDHGNLASLTAGASGGDYTDADFAIHTPKSSLTFSS